MSMICRSVNPDDPGYGCERPHGHEGLHGSDVGGVTWAASRYPLDTTDLQQERSEALAAAYQDLAAIESVLAGDAEPYVEAGEVAERVLALRQERDEARAEVVRLNDMALALGKDISEDPPEIRRARPARSARAERAGADDFDPPGIDPGDHPGSSAVADLATTLTAQVIAYKRALRLELDGRAAAESELADVRLALTLVRSEAANWHRASMALASVLVVVLGLVLGLLIGVPPALVAAMVAALVLALIGGAG